MHTASLLKANEAPPESSRIFEEYEYGAGSWPQAFRTILKAEVMDAGDNPRFIVTSMEHISPEMAYEELYCDRGNDERYIKELKNDLACDRTSNSSFLANCMRLIISCAAYTLIHSLRSETLRGTGMAKASASTIIPKLFKIAVRLVQYKDGSSCTCQVHARPRAYYSGSQRFFIKYRHPNSPEHKLKRLAMNSSCF